MSNAGQIGLAIVGGIVGFAVGGPMGAAYGLQLGLAVGTIVSPTQLPGTFGPKLTDKRTTTAQLGTPIAEVFGTDVVGGTVIWLGEVVEIATEEEVGGKGGPEGTYTTYTYTQSIAIGLCRGPAQGLLRIWENGKLVYDAREIQEGESDAAYAERITATVEYAEKFTLYLGGEEQEPDPTIELKEGVGNVPAYRGLMYIVYTDRLLQDTQALRHPSFKFEVTNIPVVLPPPPPVHVVVPLFMRVGRSRDAAETAEFVGFQRDTYYYDTGEVRSLSFGKLGTATNINSAKYQPYYVETNSLGHEMNIFYLDIDSYSGMGAGFGDGFELHLGIDTVDTSLVPTFTALELISSSGVSLGLFLKDDGEVPGSGSTAYEWLVNGLYFSEGEKITVRFYPPNGVLIP